MYSLKRDDLIVMTKDLEEDIKKTKSGLSSCYAAHGPVRKVPNYSTDIASAWEVVKYLSCLRTKPKSKNDRLYFYKPVIRLEFYEHDGEYECRIGRVKGFDNDTDVVARAEQRNAGEIDGQPCWSEEQDRAMCLAICRAALKVVS